MEGENVGEDEPELLTKRRTLSGLTGMDCLGFGVRVEEDKEKDAEVAQAAEADVRIMFRDQTEGTLEF